MRAAARGLLCYWAVNELNMPTSDLARKLTMTPSGVSYIFPKGSSAYKNAKSFRTRPSLMPKSARVVTVCFR